jgi:hypothetical protein
MIGVAYPDVIRPENKAIIRKKFSFGGWRLEYEQNVIFSFF